MGNLSHPGYAEWKFSKRRMMQIVDGLVPNLPKAARDLKADCLIVHGTSGVWMAGLLVALQDLPVVLVRKPNENSHGYNVEGPDNVELHRGIVIDDTVCSGRTIQRIGSILYESTRDSLKVVGVATYLGGWQDGTVPGYDYDQVPIRNNGIDFPVYQDPEYVPIRFDDSPLTYSVKEPIVSPNRIFSAGPDTLPVYGTKQARPSSLLTAMAQRMATA